MSPHRRQRSLLPVKLRLKPMPALFTRRFEAQLHWLISLPFRVVGITFEALFALLRAILMLPARVLGYRPGR